MAEYGANALTAEDREPWYVLFLKQLANALVSMLISAALVKVYFKRLVDAVVTGTVPPLMSLVGFVK